MQQRSGQADQERKAGEDTAGDQGEDARRGVALAEIGEQVEPDDGADEGDEEEVGLQVARDGQTDQVFAAAGGLPGARSRMSTSCERRSSGTGNTITVFRSTPISVSVCR